MYTLNDEHWVMYRIIESLYCTPETDIRLYVTILELETNSSNNTPPLSLLCISALPLNRDVTKKVGERMRDRELHCFFSSHAWAVSSGEGSRLWSQTAWAHLPTLVLTSFVIWGKPFTFDRTLLSRLKVELIIVTTSQVLQKLCKATMQSAWHKAWVIINVCKC